ncbi:MAG: hypothetical protein C5B49_13390 [Bdellovibrio sp.]|nr:MAG: hypothetical protein C5B49_13390 [Bdellovibrio sp.]
MKDNIPFDYIVQVVKNSWTGGMAYYLNASVGPTMNSSIQHSTVNVYMDRNKLTDSFGLASPPLYTHTDGKGQSESYIASLQLNPANPLRR